MASTTAGDWLDRIAVHGLGIRTNAALSVHPEGVLFDRSGAGPSSSRPDSLTGVRQESGMAGKFVEKDGLLVLTLDARHPRRWTPASAPGSADDKPAPPAPCRI